MSTLETWMGIVFILILVFLFLSKDMKGNEIIGSLGKVQIDTIKALQGQSVNQSVG